jgi:peptidoglycan/xylan/chitin deacetylase (PgdA/CDA1 family)
LTGPGARPKRLEFEGQVWTTATDEEREVARAELHALTQPRSAEQIERVLETLRAWAGVDTPDSTRRPDGDAAPSDVRPMTIDELKHLAATPRLEIGAHTRDHVNLGHQPGQEVRAQVERSRDDVAQWTGERPVGFSYPFGIPRHDVSEEARSVVAAAGFGYAVVNQPTAVEAGGNVYAIPRVFAPDVGGPEFHAFLQRVLR